MSEREDRQDIADVLVRYATGIDRRDWPLFRTVFTDDCELDYGEVGSWNGVDADHRIHGAGACDGGPHHASVDQSGHHASTATKPQSRTYVDALIMVGDNNSGVNAAGFYDDELVRDDDGWRIARRRFTQVRVARSGSRSMTFATKYGPWALVAGASDGVGAAFAEGLAERGVNVVLLARRQAVLDQVAAEIADRTGVQTRTLAIDLAEPGAASQVVDATADLEIGLLVYCAGADPNFEPFLANPIETAEAMVQRNCIVPMQLCHHFAPAMVQRGSGGIVLFGSGAGLAGGPNMVAYGATKAFDMVFTEALWGELHDKGVDVLGLILGKTNTPALRRLEYSRGQLSSEDAAPTDADSVDAGDRRGVRKPRQRANFDGRRHDARRRADAGVVDPQRSCQARHASSGRGHGRRH